MGAESLDLDLHKQSTARRNDRRSDGARQPSEPLFRRSPRALAVHRLKALIRSGELAAGSDLPTERALSNRLDLPRATVNRAIALLQEQGVVRHAGGRRRVVVGLPGSGPLAGTVVVLAPPLERSEEALGPAHSEHLTFGVMSELRVAEWRALILDCRDTTVEDLAVLAAEHPLGVVVAPIGVGATVDPDELAEALTPFTAYGVPVVAFGDEPGTQFDRVVHDHEAGAFLVTRWLIERGRRRIVQHLVEEQSHMAWCRARRAGYERAMREAGLEPLPVLHTPWQPDLPASEVEAVDRSARQLVGFLMASLAPEAEQPADALFVASDLLLPQIARACRLVGREPGDDLLVAGYDNACAGTGESSCVTVEKGYYRCGQALVRLLQQRLAAGRGPVQRVLMPPELLVPGEADASPAAGSLHTLGRGGT